MKWINITVQATLLVLYYVCTRFKCCDVSGFRHEVDMSALLCDITQIIVAIPCRSFGTTYLLFQTLFVSSFYWMKYFLTSHVIGHRIGCQNNHALFHDYFHRSFLVLRTKSESGQHLNSLKYVSFETKQRCSGQRWTMVVCKYEQCTTNNINLLNSYLLFCSYTCFKEWNSAILLPVYKKGNRKDPNSYREIVPQNLHDNNKLKIKNIQKLV